MTTLHIYNDFVDSQKEVLLWSLATPYNNIRLQGHIIAFAGDWFHLLTTKYPFQATPIMQIKVPKEDFTQIYTTTFRDNGCLNLMAVVCI